MIGMNKGNQTLTGETTMPTKWEKSVDAVFSSDGSEVQVQFMSKEKALEYLKQIETTNKAYSADPRILKGIKSGDVVCVTNRAVEKLKFFRQSDIENGVHLEPNTWKQEPHENNVVRETK